MWERVVQASRRLREATAAESAVALGEKTALSATDWRAWLDQHSQATRRLVAHAMAPTGQRVGCVGELEPCPPRAR